MSVPPVISVLPYLNRNWTAEFNCWDFIREIFATEFGVALAPHEIGVATAIKEADAEVIQEEAKVDVWEKVSKPETADVVLLGKRGCRFHVGFMVTPTRVLHLNHGAPSSAVPLNRLTALFQTVAFYRHASLRNRN